VSTDSPESPCIRNCCLDDQDQCLGCGRLLEEILAWGNASDSQRRKIIANASQRRQLLSDKRLTGPSATGPT